MRIIIIDNKRHLFNDEVCKAEQDENINRLMELSIDKNYSFDEVLESDV